nr:hypothetical protein [Planctomycetota bacterium]
NQDSGAPYWLDRQTEIGIDVAKSVHGIEDLSILGPMDEEVLATRPIEDFIPRILLADADYVLAETAGTLGRPKFAVHRIDEFRSAFVTPFVRAAKRAAFPPPLPLAFRRANRPAYHRQGRPMLCEGP